jgi:hypothetical protein
MLFATILVVSVFLQLMLTFACMIICVAKVILYQDTQVQPKVIMLATSCQAIDYTRCCVQLF